VGPIVSGPRKRGRPPRAFTSSDGTEIPYRDIGLDRKRISDYIAIASIPDDVFEKRLADAQGASIGKARRICSTQSLVRLACELGATNRKAPMRDPSALDDARKALATLSRADRIALVRELVAGIGSAR
jgi:hypothetical protein